MTASRIQMLSRTVAIYDSRTAPVTPTAVAAEVDADVETVRTCFDDLESKCLLKSVTGGYRPTVTGRELLELDVDDDALLILDTEPEN